ncbi:hypothetical protein FACS189465_1470 [Clostridia bacterium]|nr:hypothetical protein FACS189465_1470 [Clostridia bacterium]
MLIKFDDIYPVGAEQNLAEALGNKEVLSQISKMDTKALNEAFSSVEGIKPLNDEEAKKVIEKAAELQKASSKDIEEMLDEVSGGASLAWVKSSLENALAYAKGHPLKAGAGAVGAIAGTAVTITALIFAVKKLRGSDKTNGETDESEYTTPFDNTFKGVDIYGNDSL